MILDSKLPFEKGNILRHKSSGFIGTATKMKFQMSEDNRKIINMKYLLQRDNITKWCRVEELEEVE